VAWSSDDVYLAVAHGGSPYVTIYKRSGDAFEKLLDPADLPTGLGNWVAFSPGGTHLAVSHASSRYLTIYKRSGDTFTKLPNPADLPAGTGYGVAFSPDSAYLAVVHSNSPYITIYKSALSYDVETEFAVPVVDQHPERQMFTYIKAE
jgi:WD40 repeat protein